jgi:acyl-CoA thioesterase
VTSGFDADTALERRPDGSRRGRVPAHWQVQRGPNGGFVAALMLRAMSAEVGDPERTPRSLTVHFPSAPEEGPVSVRAAVERAGRSMSTASARLEQDGRTVALALAAFGLDRDGPRYGAATMPRARPVEEARPMPVSGPRIPPFVRNYEMRWAVGGPPFSGAGEATAGGWIRPAQPRAGDALLVTAMLDAWLPAIFSRLRGPAAVPTVDLTVHFRAPLTGPAVAPGAWYLVEARSRTAREGFWEEDAELWSADGVLLAQSRQLALVMGVEGAASDAAPAGRRDGVR